LDLERKKVDLASNGRPVKPEIVFDHLVEGIGLALDIPGDRMFMTDLGWLAVYRESGRRGIHRPNQLRLQRFA
jgi:hypothetical protein